MTRTPIDVTLLALMLVAACGGADGASPDAAPIVAGQVTLIATPFRIMAGETAVLTWSAEGATALELVGIGDVTGRASATVMPTTTTLYELRATLPSGVHVATASVIVGTAPVDQPTWRQGMAAFEWKLLPSTGLTVVPSPPLVGELDADGVPIVGGLGGRIHAWNGLAADPATSRLYSAANGGHADWAGNEVYELELAQEEPGWIMLRAPTAAQYVYRGDYNTGRYSDYYLDGRPGSTHSYYALHFLPSRGAVFRFGAGSLYGTGNEGNNHIDAFVLNANDWVAAGTHPDLTPTRTDSINLAVCRDPITDEVYVGSADNLRRYDPAGNVVDVLAPWLDNHTAVKAAACAVDRARGRVVFFGDAYAAPDGGLLYDVASDTWSKITFTGPATNSAVNWHEAYAYYDETYGAFLLKPSASATVVRIEPTTWVATALTTTGGAAQPDAINGVQTRFQYLPQLGGYAYFPTDAAVWFLATE